MSTLKQRALSGPILTINSVNIEGLSACKEQLLEDICLKRNCDVLCLQETHRDSSLRRPKINGMRLVAERPHRQYGSAIFAKPNLQVQSCGVSDINNIEVLTMELSDCTITSVYKPPATEFLGANVNNFNKNKINLIVGDFNSHSSQWGYQEDDNNGEAVIHWAEINNLKLIHDNKLPPSFNSGRWSRGYNPDLIFVSQQIAPQCIKNVGTPIPNTQHRPIICQIISAVRPCAVPFRRRYNFRKANWPKFQSLMEDAVAAIAPEPASYGAFTEAIQRCSRQSIPRGCRGDYVEGLTAESQDKLNNYLTLFETNPLSEETIAAGQELILSISEGRRKKWITTVEELDMGRSSQKAWKLLRHLNNDPTHSPGHAPITANQIANQLLINGKPERKPRKSEARIHRHEHQETNHLSSLFSMEELERAIARCKLRKAAGLDEILVEQIKQLGPKAKQWMLIFYNNCLETYKIPAIWRKTKVIAILKPGKTSDDPRNYRPISLLCHTYKILERMIHNRLSAAIDPHLIPEQAGFRPGKSTSSQIINLTQFIENGYEGRKITAAAFIDLTAAYDTINQRMLLQKIYDITCDFKLTSMIQVLLQNRMFFVDFQGRRSRWRTQKNGLPQGSVLAPTLFNIYTNDQPLSPGTNNFIYADDRVVAVQGDSFEEVEEKLGEALEELNQYYINNQLRPNPSKTLVCAFHLRNKQASRRLQITWRGMSLQHCPNPKYLGVTLDRALTYKQHCTNTKLKVSSRNNILRKITSTAWGAKPEVLKATALSVCFSAGEYASSVWYKSAHAKQVDIALNETCRLITGCLKPTPTERVYHLAGIAPPAVRREAAAYGERRKAETSEKHPLHGSRPANKRLKSRRSFLRTTEDFQTRANSRIEEWRGLKEQHWMEPSEDLAPGHDESWGVWKSLNRLRTNTTRSKDNLQRWGYPVVSNLCDCGAVQTTQHMYSCPDCPAQCTLEDLMSATPNAVDVARFWAKYS